MEVVVNYIADKCNYVFFTNIILEIVQYKVCIFFGTELQIIRVCFVLNSIIKYNYFLYKSENTSIELCESLGQYMYSS